MAQGAFERAEGQAVPCVLAFTRLVEARAHARENGPRAASQSLKASEDLLQLSRIPHLPAQTRDRTHRPREGRPAKTPPRPWPARRPAAGLRPRHPPPPQHRRTPLQPTRGIPRHRDQAGEDRHFLRSGSQSGVVPALGRIGSKAGPGADHHRWACPRRSQRGRAAAERYATPHRASPPVRGRSGFAVRGLLSRPAGGEQLNAPGPTPTPTPRSPPGCGRRACSGCC